MNPLRASGSKNEPPLKGGSLVIPEDDRYIRAAADYLFLPVDHPQVIGSAHRAQKIADGAAVEFLRAISGKKGGGR